MSGKEDMKQEEKADLYNRINSIEKSVVKIDISQEFMTKQTTEIKELISQHVKHETPKISNIEKKLSIHSFILGALGTLSIVVFGEFIKRMVTKI